MDGKWVLGEEVTARAIHRPPNAPVRTGYAIRMIKRLLKLLALKKMFDAFRERRRHAQPH